MAAVRHFLAMIALASMLVACHASEELPIVTDRATQIRQPQTSRLPPPEVPAVSLDGLRYAQHPGNLEIDGQTGGMLSAYSPDGKIQWTLKVYDNRRDPAIEGDVQDVYFRSLSVDPDGRLRIVNERGETFLVERDSRTITALPSAIPALGPGRLRPEPQAED